MDTPPAIAAREAAWKRAEEIRRENRSPYRLEQKVRIINRLAAEGYYEVPEPTEGENLAIVHTRDTEIWINGYIMWDGIVFTPGRCDIYIKLAYFNDAQSWLRTVTEVYDELVWEWISHDENLYVANPDYSRDNNRFLSPLARHFLGVK